MERNRKYSFIRKFWNYNSNRVIWSKYFYFGCKNIKEIYPEGGYILIEDIDHLGEISNLLKNINENADKIYSENIDSIRKIKKRYFEEYNLLKLIIEL